jgi:hypothetical protein
LAAAQQWGGTGDTLMTTKEASLAFYILKKSYLKVRPSVREPRIFTVEESRINF